MTAAAAPDPGRRVSAGSIVALAGFLLLAPPLFLLAPLALLILLARPRTLREGVWFALSVVGIGLAGGGTGLAAGVLRFAAVAIAIAFGLSSLRGRGPFFPRALGALFIGVLAVAIWLAAQGLSWADVIGAFDQMLRASYQSLVEVARDDPARQQSIQNFVRQLLDSSGDVARLIPGFFALEALAGLALAWRWHHIVSVAPLGRPAAAFREFRFNDHLVWGAILTLGLFLAPLPAAATALAANLLVVWAGLYAMRGLAIAARLFAPAPAPLKVLLAGLAILLFPIALGVTVAMGLADTWLDIRGRLTPPAPGGTSP